MDTPPSFKDCKDAEKKFLSAGTLSSVLKILCFAKILGKKFYFASIISVCSTPS
jgi:hypothetical protein